MTVPWVGTGADRWPSNAIVMKDTPRGGMVQDSSLAPTLPESISSLARFGCAAVYFVELVRVLLKVGAFEARCCGRQVPVAAVRHEDV